MVIKVLTLAISGDLLSKYNTLKLENGHPQRQITSPKYEVKFVKSKERQGSDKDRLCLHSNKTGISGLAWLWVPGVVNLIQDPLIS